MWFELVTEEPHEVTCEATFRPAMWQQEQLVSLPSLDALSLGLTWSSHLDNHCGCSFVTEAEKLLPITFERAAQLTTSPQPSALTSGPVQ